MENTDKAFILELLNERLTATETKLKSAQIAQSRPAGEASGKSFVTTKMRENFRDNKIAAIPAHEAEIAEIKAIIARLA